MMNKRLNSIPEEYDNADEDLTLENFYFDDGDEFELPYESAMEP